VLQCVAVCCSVLQCVAVCCSVLQCVAVWCNVLQCDAVWCSVLQCVAVCFSVDRGRLWRPDLTINSIVRHELLKCVPWLICMWHDSFICVTWLIYMCNMIHSYILKDSCMCVTWLCDLDAQIQRSIPSSFICVTWLILCVTCLIHMCGVTHLCVCHESFICLEELKYMCDKTLWLWRPDSTIHFLFIHMWDVTHSYVGYYSFMSVTWLIRIYVKWLNYICGMTHVNVW